jgi:hypothetical protein
LPYVFVFRIFGCGRRLRCALCGNILLLIFGSLPRPSINFFFWAWNDLHDYLIRETSQKPALNAHFSHAHANLVRAGGIGDPDFSVFDDDPSLPEFALDRYLAIFVQWVSAYDAGWVHYLNFVGLNRDKSRRRHGADRGSRQARDYDEPIRKSNANASEIAARFFERK